MNVFFMGAKAIGLACFNLLIDEFSRNNKIRIVGVLTNSRDVGIRARAKELDIEVFDSLDQYLKLENIDLNISVQYHEILKSAHLAVSKCNVNLHMAPLPEYRGCNQFSLAILDQVVEFGTTIHLIDQGIDSGDILFEKRFSISNNIWVKDLYDLTYDKSIELFSEALPDLIAGNYMPEPQSNRLNNKQSKLCYRKEIDKLKLIDFSWDAEKIKRTIRATYMPGFEPPYAMVDGEKVYIGAVND